MTAKAWVVRAGSRGEHEQWNLDKSVSTIGWDVVGDIASCSSKEDVHRLLIEIYAGDSEQKLANWAAQLWAFRGRIQVGDLIIMPSKLNPGYVYFGRAAGPYSFDASNPDLERRKFLPVEWNKDPTPKAGMRPDLVSSLGAIQTVFSPSKNDAANRLLAMARTGEDPGFGQHEALAELAPVPDYEEAADDDVVDPVALPSQEVIRDRIRSFITENYREHELTELVADILSAHGFQCDVSPPGPDGGVDILAGMGPLGMDSPTVVVEVKSQPGPVGSTVVRGLYSARDRYQANQALLVAWGGITRQAEQEFRRDRTFFRVWDGEMLLDELLANYEHLPRTTQDLIPLRQTWVLDEDMI